MDVQNEKLLKAALDYAKRGWYVVPDHSVDREGKCTCEEDPCRSPGKHPRISREDTHALLRRTGSIKVSQIHQWWEKWPDSNVAIVCGMASDLVAIDVDKRNGGFKTLERLIQKHGDFTNTLTILTGGGGKHLLFHHPQRGYKVRNRIGLYPGIDVKADGGRIVSPPSKHQCGKNYEWKNIHQEIKRLPSWLLNAIQNEKGTGTRSALMYQNLRRDL